MSKISQKEIAKELYLSGKSLVDISKELNVSTTSLHRWSKAENWKKLDKNEDIYKTKISEGMHKLASRLLEDITADYFDSGELNAERFSAFDHLMGRINGAKKYDDETNHAEEKHAITSETIAKVLKEIM
jgi:soluble cytochrome b562